MSGTLSTPGTFLLVGHPNVGKSVLFHRLTGAYVNVSNYPGTTVEVSRGVWKTTRDAATCDCEDCTCDESDQTPSTLP